VTETKDPSKLTDIIAVHLNAQIEQKQDLLEEVDVATRLTKILDLITGEASVLKVEKKIRGRVKRQMEKTQREYYLNEQMKAIQTELGGKDGADEFDEIQTRIEKSKSASLSIWRFKPARRKSKAPSSVLSALRVLVRPR